MRTSTAWLLGAVACSGGPPPTQDTEPEVPAWVAPTAGVVDLVTRDAVTLKADYRPAATEGAPAVVLLHMIPPSNDRTTWPASFVDALAAKGFTVLVPDRRGAGESGGVARDAYEGETPKYDVEACAKRVRDDGYGPLAVIGASNGTTAMIDYAVWAGDEGLPVPVALGFMTGGSYTESQTAMSSVPQLPSVFTFSTAEREWSVAQEPLNPGSWVFHEYDGGDHGTRMFTVKPEVADHLVAFLDGALQR